MLENLVAYRLHQTCRSLSYKQRFAPFVNVSRNAADYTATETATTRLSLLIGNQLPADVRSVGPIKR